MCRSRGLSQGLFESLARATCDVGSAGAPGRAGAGAGRPGNGVESRGEAGRRGGGLSGEAAAYGHTRYAHMHAYLHIDLSYKHASTKAHSFPTKCTYANF